MHDYTAYGLHIRSAVALPFAHWPGSAAEAPDVVIGFAKTPTALSAPVDRIGKLHPRELAPGAFLLTVAGRVRFHVIDGREIRIEPLGGGIHDVRAFLTGPVLAALLKQHGVAAFHASAVATKDGAILFLGKGGSGKSSLGAALIARGYDLLSDDIAGVVVDEGGRPMVLPAFPTLKLWQDTMEVMDLQGGVRVWPGQPKYLVKVKRFRPTPALLHAVFILEDCDHPDIEIAALDRPADILKSLERNAYRKRFLFGLGQFRTWFRISTTIAKFVPAAHVRRPARPLRLVALANRIEEYIEARRARAA